MCSPSLRQAFAEAARYVWQSQVISKYQQQQLWSLWGSAMAGNIAGFPVRLGLWRHDVTARDWAVSLYGVTRHEFDAVWQVYVSSCLYWIIIVECIYCNSYIACIFFMVYIYISFIKYVNVHTIYIHIPYSTLFSFWRVMWCLFGLSQGREVQGDHLQMPGAESVADFQPRREWALQQLFLFFSIRYSVWSEIAGIRFAFVVCC